MLYDTDYENKSKIYYLSLKSDDVNFERKFTQYYKYSTP